MGRSKAVLAHQLGRAGSCRSMWRRCWIEAATMLCSVVFPRAGAVGCMSIRNAALIPALALFFLAAAGLWAQYGSANVVTVDFAVPAGPPLSKSKFTVYNAIGPTAENVLRDMDALAELNVEALRLELAWGRGRGSGMGIANVVTGAADALKYDFAPLERIVRALGERGMHLHAAYCYTPPPLQPPEGRWRSSARPIDVEKWADAAAATARHFRDIGFPFGIHEIWNEPDNPPFFFSGTEADYQQMFAAASRAIREVEPLAVIAGPAVAWGKWYESFPKFVKENRLPLDVFTFHHYGSPAIREVHAVAGILSRDPYFATTEMNLDEFQSADCCSWPKGSAQDKHEGAVQLLEDFHTFLEHPELTTVSWAQFSETCLNCRDQFLGLITWEGVRKAAYNAFKIYGTLPVDRRQVTVSGAQLGSLAAVEQHRAGLVLWNAQSYVRWVVVNFKKTPFPKGNVRIYRIDEKHASPGDGAFEPMQPVESFTGVPTAGWSWKGPIPEHGIVYFECEDGTGISELTPAKVARVLRVHRYYPDRDTRAYADFDRKTWTARLGMDADGVADQEIGVTAEQWPKALEISSSVEGSLQKLNSDSLFGIRFDFWAAGAYASSVLFHGSWNGGVDLYDERRKAAMPWGTRRAPDQAVKVPNMARFRAILSNYAPANWSGRALITFLLQNAGPGAQVKVKVREAGI